MRKILSVSLIGLVLLSISFVLGAFVADKSADGKITLAMILQAQKIMGLDFTDAEADSMLTDVNDQLDSYVALWKLQIPNEVSPALNFNPLPAGYQFPDKANYFKTNEIKGVLPVNREELAFYNIRQLSYLIKSRQISSVELTRFFIDRLKKYNPVLLNVVTITEERAMKQAAKADAEIKAGKYRGPLHGIPFGAKDLLAVKGYKTTWGSVAYKNQDIDMDATVISRLENAGAVLIAKTTLGELAMGDVWFGGKTKNPWDINRGSSGSSAGSASAVAAGCMPFAIGSETLGSIVSPSTECGTTGLRPTFGRISKHGAMALSWSMDKLGPIARSAEDCAIVLNSIEGVDQKDLSVIAAPFTYISPGASLKGVKIGYLKTEFDRAYPNHKNDSLSLIKLKELGAELIPVEIPNMPYGDMTIVLSAEAGAAFDELTRSNRDDLLVKQDKNAWPNAFRSARFIPAVEYIQANRARSLLIEKLQSMMKGIDLYMAPSFSQNLRATNLSGHPCVVLPNGFNKEGRPSSITFTGQLFGEGKLLQVAEVYQNSTQFNKQHPKMNFAF
ncbi:amidase [Daejeonella oryzae]|uniref:amidase n=1 Tax=Daejeonella oryzae TaxID=1122943 RepID=UPI000419AAE1|nr:amidase [Daejeonella oryzae]